MSLVIHCTKLSVILSSTLYEWKLLSLINTSMINFMTSKRWFQRALSSACLIDWLPIVNTLVHFHFTSLIWWRHRYFHNLQTNCQILKVSHKGHETTNIYKAMFQCVVRVSMAPKIGANKPFIWDGWFINQHNITKCMIQSRRIRSPMLVQQNLFMHIRKMVISSIVYVRR